MKCPCKGCADRTITCHSVCRRYAEWKDWKEEGNRVRAAEAVKRSISHDQEMKYRKNLKQGGKRK